MKRLDFVAHLQKEGCVFQREGSSHTVFVNPQNGHPATVPRHRELDIMLARRICRQLGIPVPKARA